MDIDEFSDDGLDDLSSNVLQELEDNAISLTQGRLAQQQTQAKAQAPPITQDDAAGQREYYDLTWDEDEGLDTSEIINPDHDRFPRPPINNGLHQQGHQAGPPMPNPRWNPVIEPRGRSATSDATNPTLIGRQHFPHAVKPSQPVFGSQRFQTGQQGPAGHANQFVKPPVPPQRPAPSQAGVPASQRQTQNPPGDMVSALQQRLRVLEADLNAAKGEAAILRTNSSKSEQKHFEEVARLKKVNAEQLASQERLVEAAIAKEKSANTEMRFMQQDMREATDRTRKKRPAAGADGGPPITPKKASKSWSMADGFDDMEMVSPSKAQGRARNAGTVAANVGERTPTKNKRKRPMVESPVMALETHSGDVIMRDKSAPPETQPETETPAAVVVNAPAPPFEFLQLVLDHAAFHHEPPTFDALSRLAFPSEPETTLSMQIFQMLPMMGAPHRPIQLLVDFAELAVSLWERSSAEQFYEPIRHLVALITFTFQLQTTVIAPFVIHKLVPIATTTVCALAEGRHRLPDGDLSKSDEYAALDRHIDTSQVLSLLHVSALACVTASVDTEDGTEHGSVLFWRLMPIEMVMLLLTPKQKPQDIMSILDLLATSSLPNSIGPITTTKEPPFVAQAIIERVSAKLTEAIPLATTAAKRRNIRITALRTMIAFARCPFGAQQLASHPNALPRLVTCLSATIDEVYDQPLSRSVFQKGSGVGPPDMAPPSTLADLHGIISQSVLLIHKLVTDPKTANTVDIGQKLSMSYGGSQRYLIALGRLAFAEEDLVIEAGIDGEIVEAAHELLEMAVTPDEGENISEAFGA